MNSLFTTIKTLNLIDIYQIRSKNFFKVQHTSYRYSRRVSPGNEFIFTLQVIKKEILNISEKFNENKEDKMKTEKNYSECLIVIHLQKPLKIAKLR